MVLSPPHTAVPGQLAGFSNVTGPGQSYDPSDGFLVGWPWLWLVASGQQCGFLHRTPLHLHKRGADEGIPKRRRMPDSKRKEVEAT